MQNFLAFGWPLGSLGSSSHKFFQETCQYFSCHQAAEYPGNSFDVNPPTPTFPGLFPFVQPGGDRRCTSPGDFIADSSHLHIFISLERCLEFGILEIQLRSEDHCFGVSHPWLTWLSTKTDQADDQGRAFTGALL